MSVDLNKELEALRAENAALKANQAARVKVSVSDKGCVMVTGLRKWPIALYESEWTQIFAVKDQILACAKTNADEIAKRNVKSSPLRAVG